MILDDCQRAYEVCVRVVEGQLLKLATVAERDRLAAKLVERVKLMMTPTARGEAA